MRKDSCTLLGGRHHGLILPKEPELILPNSLRATEKSLQVRGDVDWIDVIPALTEPSIDPFAGVVRNLLHFDGNYANAASASRPGVPTTAGGSIGFNHQQSPRFGSTCLMLQDRAGVILNTAGWNTSAYTVECWVYMTPGSSTTVFSGPRYGALPNYNSVSCLAVISDTSFSARFLDQAGWVHGAALLPVTPGKWTHVALIRVNAFQFRISVDGVLSPTAQVSRHGSIRNENLAHQIGYGPSHSAPQHLSGTCYIDEFVFTNAVRYTENFIPRSTQYALE